MSIRITDLNFSYGTKQVLRGIHLDIEPAQTLSILGPNGAGKTTLLNAIAGLEGSFPDNIAYNGQPYRHFSPRQMARLVGYVPQIIVPTFDYSVVDYVVTGCAPQLGTFQRPGQEHYDIAVQAIREMGIEHLAEKSYRQISGGEQQQVSIARVLAQGPSYILMDEPTSHLDYGNQVRVLKTIRRLAQSGFGVIFTTHNPDQALLLGGRTAIIDRGGNLICGESHKLISEPFLKELYGVQLCISGLERAGRCVCFAPNLGDGGN
ncbi:MAG: ABC transporter ATP-binding protein [Dehalococcoidia bacterium]|nr:ABC transporter ATP-binding protein [Dehalococcoidia bacterium]